MKIVEIISHLKNINLTDYNEEKIKQHLVFPVLQDLGWNTFDIEPEYLIEGKRVDYALVHNNKPRVFIEAKRPSQDLLAYEEQLLMYAFKESVDMAILTNGLVWWFYLPLETQYTWRDRRFYELDVFSNDVSLVDSNFQDYLSKSAVIQGDALSLAKNKLEESSRGEIIEEMLPNAFNDLIQQEDGDLIKLLCNRTKKLSNILPTDDEVKEFLRRLSSIELIKESGGEVISGAPDPGPGKYKSKRSTIRCVINWKAMGVDKEIETIYEPEGTDTLVKLIKRLFDERGDIVYQKLKEIRVRGIPLILNYKTDTYHQQTYLGYKEMWVTVHSSTKDKVTKIIPNIVSVLSMPKHSINVEIVEK